MPFEKKQVNRVNNLRNNPTNQDIPRQIEVMWNREGIAQKTLASTDFTGHWKGKNHPEHQLLHSISRPV